jgi:hypothetical protein
MWLSLIRGWEILVVGRLRMVYNLVGTIVRARTITLASKRVTALELLPRYGLGLVEVGSSIISGVSGNASGC